MKRLHVIAIFILLLLLPSCMKEMRYTSEEIQNYPPNIQEHIKKGEIVPLMTPAQVRYSWGSPSQIRVLSPTKEGREKVEWVYKRLGGVFSTKLVFIDGELREIVSNEPGVSDTFLTK